MNISVSEQGTAPSVLLVKSGGPRSLPDWQRHFSELAPHLRVRGWYDESVIPEEVHYVFVWEPEAGRIARYSNLRLILSSAAGVDHILADADLPKHLPIVRMVTQETSQRMADFVVMSALMLVRQMPQIMQAQYARRWDEESPKGRMAMETTVGVLGLGQLGTGAATKLAAVGFRVQGWSRTPKAIEHVCGLTGDDGLATLLSTSDIVVNLLPDTPSTYHLLNERTIASMPRGSALINVGRANQVDHDALLDALNSGQLAGAVLDVFETEPLPPGHPLWSHPSVIVTPHIASAVSMRGKAKQVASVIAASLAHQPIPNLYDRALGY